MRRRPCNVRDCMIDFVLTHIKKGIHTGTGEQVPHLQGKA
jgi:hypothetical protein